MFVPFWFLDRSAREADKGEMPFWTGVGMLVRPDYFGTDARVASATCLAIQMTLIAALVGWMIQAVIVILWSLGRRALRSEDSASRLNEPAGNHS
jgi:hypothetical protein